MKEQLSSYWKILIEAVKQQVKPALGCTEPISLALAAATAARYLQHNITRISAEVSPNLMKNGMGVTVPGTGMVGLSIAASLGAVAGDSEAGLEVLKNATPEQVELSKNLLNSGIVCVSIKKPAKRCFTLRLPLKMVKTVPPSLLQVIILILLKLSIMVRWCLINYHHNLNKRPHLAKLSKP